MDGATVLTQSLARMGVEYMFGVVGIPVIEVAMAAQAAGIKFIGMRNEQAASYAAQAVGYMTGTPGCCLVVSGPGVIHALAGLANAQSNCWPMILVGGACDTNQEGTGAFQETPQTMLATPYCKYAARPDSIARIPFFVEKAVRMSMYGRPGPVYLDVPGDFIRGTVDAVDIPAKLPAPPRAAASEESIASAVRVLKEAKRPLIIVGKGAAIAQAEKEVRRFIEATGIPYLPTPMGKGVLPDDHPQCVSAARSVALKEADVVVLLGARLNWILHFGLPPRFAKDVKIIQVDVCPEEMHSNVVAAVPVLGDVKLASAQLEACARGANLKFPLTAAWWKTLQDSVAANQAATSRMMADDSVPMGYYRVYKSIREVLPKDAIIIGEGANTMDIGRTLMQNYLPRHRLDAGTYGTMGVGLGFAIAAAMLHPDKKVVAVLGDSAFGFSGMELETACRFRLPITVIIVNNNGIYNGTDGLEGDPTTFPPTALTVSARYERVCEAFGGKGYFVQTPAELEKTLPVALADTVPSVVNVMITPYGQRKKQQFDWLTRSKL